MISASYHLTKIDFEMFIFVNETMLNVDMKWDLYWDIYVNYNDSLHKKLLCDKNKVKVVCSRIDLKYFEIFLT